MNEIAFESICSRDIVINQSHTLPIFASSTFVYPNLDKAVKAFRGEEDMYIYSRWDNPTIQAVEDKIAQLEAFDIDTDAYSVLFGSGMAAISAAINSALPKGGTIFTHANLYGTTIELMTEILDSDKYAIVYFTSSNYKEILEKAADGGGIVYVETPNNPTLTCLSLEDVSKRARAKNLITIVDATFASPFGLRPLTFDIDMVVHSTTKYMNGHGTSLGGVLSTRSEDFNSKAWRLRKTMGAVLSPFDAWLLNNGLKTLPLRMQKHSANGQEVAEFLNNHTAISRVHYPGLPSHPSHSVANKEMNCHTGMLAFELNGGFDAAVNFMNKIKFCTLTATLGTTDTLIQHPASMTHVRVPKNQLEKAGISQGMIRMSVGLESSKDIIKDLKQALA